MRADVIIVGFTVILVDVVCAWLFILWKNFKKRERIKKADKGFENTYQEYLYV